MNYMIRLIRAGEVILVDTFDEHPDEDYLRRLVETHRADFVDVCRTDETPQL